MVTYRYCITLFFWMLFRHPVFYSQSAQVFCVTFVGTLEAAFLFFSTHFCEIKSIWSMHYSE